MFGDRACTDKRSVWPSTERIAYDVLSTHLRQPQRVIQCELAKAGQCQLGTVWELLDIGLESGPTIQFVEYVPTRPSND